MFEGGFRIAKAELNDWEPAMEMVWKTFLKFEAPEYGEEGVKNFLDFISGQQLYQMFMLGEYPMWIALEEADDIPKKRKIVGVGSLRAGNHISLLFVDEDYQRRGIGKMLVKTMQAHSATQGKIKLTVNSSPYGEDFYHKLGFMDTEKKLRTDGIIYTPMVLMYEI